MNKIAIVVVAYNRVDTLSRLLTNLLACNYEGDEIPLIISIDKSDTSDVELYADSFEWKFGLKIVVKHDNNLGLRNHMLSIGDFFKDYDALVVLEDDLAIAPNYYHFVKQTINKYKDNSNIAGISLYNFSLNYQTKRPFMPYKDEHDVFFMKCAMSWGEVWMKRQWESFYEWYKSNQDFTYSDSIPTILMEWQKSWLKYHTRYCIEQNKYFVYPYTSYSTNNSDVGVHSKRRNSLFQVPLQMGKSKELHLPQNLNDGVCYDGFFENESLYGILENLCVDLNGSKGNREHKRYWLTQEHRNYKIVHSYGLLLRPIEMNVINNIGGTDIFLYDTSINSNNPNKPGTQRMRYDYYMVDGFSTFRNYGYVQIIKEMFEYIKKKLHISK